jgi:hypothetical protein
MHAEADRGLRGFEVNVEHSTEFGFRVKFGGVWGCRALKAGECTLGSLFRWFKVGIAPEGCPNV